MIHCKDCEFSELRPDGKRSFSCNPFENVKEPECLAKWQIIKLDILVNGQNYIISSQSQMAPLQEKIIKYVEKEIEDINESDKWRYPEEDDGFGDF